jgi:hypothetical protein
MVYMLLLRAPLWELWREREVKRALFLPYSPAAKVGIGSSLKKRM